MNKEYEALMSKLVTAIHNEDQQNMIGYSLQILATFLTDIARIAEALEKENDK